MLEHGNPTREALEVGFFVQEMPISTHQAPSNACREQIHREASKFSEIL
jgi:hypothetical protein